MAVTAIRAIEAPQRYRITVGLNDTPSTSVANYTLTRVDGSPCTAHPSLVWASDAATAELALSEPLLEGVVYSLAVTGAGSAEVAYHTPVEPLTQPAGDTGEAPGSSFGVDVCWMVGALGPGRRLERRTGRAALSHDLATIAAIAPGELFHLPTDGADLPARVNGPGNAAELRALAADVRRQWSKDRRVKRGSINAVASADGTGLVLLTGSYEDAATGKGDTIRARSA